MPRSSSNDLSAPDFGLTSGWKSASDSGSSRWTRLFLAEKLAGLYPKAWLPGPNAGTRPKQHIRSPGGIRNSDESVLIHRGVFVSFLLVFALSTSQPSAAYATDGDYSSNYTVVKCGGGHCRTVTKENSEICNFSQVE